MERFLYLMKREMCGEANPNEHDELQLKLTGEIFQNIYQVLFACEETALLEDTEIEQVYHKQLIRIKTLYRATSIRGV